MSVRPGLFISKNTDLSFAIALKRKQLVCFFKILHIYRVCCLLISWLFNAFGAYHQVWVIQLIFRSAYCISSTEFAAVTLKHKFFLSSPNIYVFISAAGVSVNVNSFLVNVTDGQVWQIGWNKLVIIFSANTFSVEDVITMIIIVQTTTFALTAYVFVDFVIQNFRRSNNIIRKKTNMWSHSEQYARLIAMAFVLAFKLLFNLFAHAQFVKTYPFIVLKTEKPSLILTEFQLLLFFNTCVWWTMY